MVSSQRIARTVAAISVGVTAALLSSGATAHADENDFLRDVQNAGMDNPGGNQSIVQAGYGVCHEIAYGVTPNKVAEHLWHVSHLTEDNASMFVNLAQSDLCPRG